MTQRKKKALKGVKGGFEPAAGKYKEGQWQTPIAC